MDLYLFIYLLAGIVQDLLFTLDIRFIALQKLWPAVIFSFLVTVVSMVVLYDIFIRLDVQRSIPAILFYATGIAVGTFLAMKFKIGSKK